MTALSPHTVDQLHPARRASPSRNAPYMRQSALLTLNSVTGLSDLIGRASDSYAKQRATILTVKCYVSSGVDRQSLNGGKFCWFLLIWRHFQLL